MSMRYDAIGRLIATAFPDGGVAQVRFRLGAIDRFNVNDTDSSPENIARGHFNTPTTEEFDIRGRLVRVIERDTAKRQSNSLPL